MTRGNDCLRAGASRFALSIALLLLSVIISLSFVSCASLKDSQTELELASEYLSIADAYAELGKHDKAIEFYLRARKRDEYRNATAYSLGRMYALSGKWREAVAMFEPLYQEESDNARVSAALAYALASVGETERALTVYEGAYKAKMDDPATNRDYAEMLLLAERPEEAISHIALVKEAFADTKVAADLDAIEKRALETIAARTKGDDAKADGAKADGLKPGK